MGGLSEGERVLIHAAAGGVGISATQIAKLRGAEVFGTASASKHDAIRAQGVDHPIDYRTEDFEKEVLRLTHGEGVDVATGKVHALSRVRAVEFGLVAGGISRDGTRVIGATGGFDPGGRHNVVTLPFAGGKPKVLVRNAFAPTWTD